MSKDSWDNYKGLQVPPKHGDLFRAMDQQERFYAEIMKMNEVSRQTAFNQLKPKVIAELNAIKNNHLIVFNSKVLNEILSKIQIGNSSDVDFLSKGDIAVDLSSYYLLGNSEIFKSVKLQIPHFFKDYKDIYNGIITPFNKVIDDLLKTTSPVEFDSIKNDFLQNLNHLNAYFEYSEGNNYQSPILEIKCKESLIQIVEDIGLKLESFNSHLNLPIIPPLVLNQSQPNQPIGNNQPMTELEKALAEIKALKEANAAKELEIANMVSREEVEQLINIEKQNVEAAKDREKEKDGIIQKVTKENAEKDGVIAEKDNLIKMQGEEKENDAKKHEVLENKFNDVNAKYTVLKNSFKMLEHEHIKDEDTIKDLRNDKYNLNKQNDKLEKENSSLKLLEKDFFDLKLSLKDAEVKKSKIKQSEKYMSNDDSEQSSWSYCGKKDLKSVSSSSSKSSVYKAKIKQLEEQNTIFKNMYIQNPKIDLIKLSSDFPENKFPTEEMQKDLSGENVDLD